LDNYIYLVGKGRFRPFSCQRRDSFDPEVSLRAERTQCEAGPKGRMNPFPATFPSRTSRPWRTSSLTS